MHQAFQLFHLIGFDGGQKAHPADVDAQKRLIISQALACGVQDRAIAAHRHDHITKFERFGVLCKFLSHSDKILPHCIGQQNARAGTPQRFCRTKRRGNGIFFF